MADLIYTVDRAQLDLTAVEPISFADLGLKEREHLEAWVCKRPEVLGEELLVISSEFHRFDRSDRRLDVLALDKDARLVVVELKLDLSGSLADLQAIRYAAFCSTMTMNDALDALCEHRDCSREDAGQAVLSFLGADELPVLGDRPRIVLAGGAIEDQELTTAVLWLRKFQVDIMCVELTLYRLPESGQVLLVPRVIIPLPEAKEYVVSVERKEASEAEASAAEKGCRDLWKAVGQRWNALQMPIGAGKPPLGSYFQLRFGVGHAHYEWVRARRTSHLCAYLHFESQDPDTNRERLGFVLDAVDVLKAAGYDVESGEWGSIGWTRLGVRLPYDPMAPQEESAAQAANAMKAVFEATWPAVQRNLMAQRLR